MLYLQCGLLRAVRPVGALPGKLDTGRTFNM